MKRNEAVQHIMFILIGLGLVGFFVWACFGHVEFRRYSLRWAFEHARVIGWCLLPISLMDITILSRLKIENQYGRDYTVNYIGFLGLIIAIGFIAYSLLT